VVLSRNISCDRGSVNVFVGMVEDRRTWRFGLRERWCCAAERLERRRDSFCDVVVDAGSMWMSVMREKPRLRVVGMSVEMDPFFVGRGVWPMSGDWSVGVVDWEVPPLEREYII